MKYDQDYVMHLWVLELRSLSLGTGNSQSFTWHIASNEQFSEKNVVAEAKMRFTSAWWAEHIITAIGYAGKLVMIDGKPLYEQD
jgi:hypothetical protein